MNETYTICITGKLNNPKSVYKKMIEENGHVYADTFCNSVTHVVAADPNSGSSKLKKATDHGIPVISEDELIDLLGNQ